LAGLAAEKVKSRAGRTAYGRKFVLVRIIFFVQAVLNVEMRIGADEDEMSHPLFVKDLQSGDLI
jgi:hypothetical protein